MELQGRAEEGERGFGGERLGKHQEWILLSESGAVLVLGGSQVCREGKGELWVPGGCGSLAMEQQG